MKDALKIFTIVNDYVMKKLTNKRNLSIGDSVYTIDNVAWGKNPMKIVGFYTASDVSCEHPSLGRGTFRAESLIHSEKNINRQILLKELEKLEKQVSKLKKKLERC
jgi:hypothetical protein